MRNQHKTASKNLGLLGELPVRRGAFWGMRNWSCGDYVRGAAI